MTTRNQLLLLGGFALALAVAFACCGLGGVDGVGIFSQEVLLESDRPIRRVSYLCWDVDEPARRRAEETADPNLFDWSQTVVVTEDRFAARVRFVTHGGLFRSTVYYPGQLVVLAEFADGTRGCRVVDVPTGRGKEPVVVRFR